MRVTDGYVPAYFAESLFNPVAHPVEIHEMTHRRRVINRISS